MCTIACDVQNITLATLQIPYGNIYIYIYIYREGTATSRIETTEPHFRKTLTCKNKKIYLENVLTGVLNQSFNQK